MQVAGQGCPKEKARQSKTKGGTPGSILAAQRGRGRAVTTGREVVGISAGWQPRRWRVRQLSRVWLEACSRDGRSRILDQIAAAQEEVGRQPVQGGEGGGEPRGRGREGEGGSLCQEQDPFSAVSITWPSPPGEQKSGSCSLPGDGQTRNFGQTMTICLFAKEARTAPAEEEEPGKAPLGASEDPDYSEVPTLALMTTDSVSSSSDLGENATDAELPETSEDHLETVTLVGIILGTIAAIGVATGIVIVIAKKMSGRYSP
ncbi:podoplanin [Crotalus adamanteus]|uniref:Podoplanin n=1 Tax=Crotalus adamanteus TaxID=8729 RepID=A0AAW1AR56_CROAD